MTDNEIIKALECCVKAPYCSEKTDCPYKGIDDCVKQHTLDALDLINRQQAEIERLKAEDEKYPFKCVMPFNSMVYSKSIEDYDRLIDDIGSDAIKEFAERVKALDRLDVDVSYGYGREHYTEAIAVNLIDNLVKEIIGE